jgi:hypothetical protein
LSMAPTSPNFGASGNPGAVHFVPGSTTSSCRRCRPPLHLDLPKAAMAPHSAELITNVSSLLRTEPCKTTVRIALSRWEGEVQLTNSMSKGAFLVAVERHGDWRLAAKDLALELGFVSPASLSRFLARHGLPRLTVLRDWRLTLRLVESWHLAGCSAMRSGWTHGIDPSTCYRAVRRATGLPWCSARAFPYAHWEREYARFIGGHVSRDTSSASPGYPPVKEPPE